MAAWRFPALLGLGNLRGALVPIAESCGPSPHDRIGVASTLVAHLKIVLVWHVVRMLDGGVVGQS